MKMRSKQSARVAAHTYFRFFVGKTNHHVAFRSLTNGTRTHVIRLLAADPQRCWPESFFVVGEHRIEEFREVVGK